MEIAFEQVFSVLIMLALISILIIAHELGHFWVAKKCGIRVERFGFGLPFGPTLWSKKVGDTEYCIHAALFGGYVAFPDDNPDSEVPPDSPERFENKTVMQRFAVAIAGVTVNAILGWLIMVMVVMAWGLPEIQGNDVTIGQVLSDRSPAAVAGLKQGDRIVSIEGETVSTEARDIAQRVTFVKDQIGAHKGEPFQMTVAHGDEMREITLTPNGEGLIGVSLLPGEKVYVRETNPVKAGLISAEFLSTFIVRNFQAIGQMITGQVDASQLSGPIRIVDEGRKMIDANGIQDGLILTAVISVILAVMNLLPIPALDGGHILFLIIEALKGSPVKKEIQERAIQFGFLTLLALMAFVLLNDINNVWLNPFDAKFAAPK